jgi:hypothetical protein
VPAGGSLALVTLAGAAALAAKVERLGGGYPTELADLSAFFLDAAEEDAAAYAASSGGADARLRCLDAGLVHLEAALELLDRVGALFEGLPPHLSADVAAAGRLARASAQTLLVNVAVNSSQWSEGVGSVEVDRVLWALATLKDRLEAG